MKKILPLVILSWIIVLKAQFVPNSCNEKEFQSFLKTKKTYVMKTGDAEFDSLLAVSLQQYWKVSPYELVSANEIGKYKGNVQYSFMEPFNFPIVFTNGNYIVTRSNMSLGVVPGGIEKYYARDQVAFVCIEPRSDYIDVHKDLTLENAYLREKFRIKDMIATLNKSIELVRDKKYEYKAGCENSVKYLLANEYNQNLPSLKTKTLYIFKENFRNPQDISKIYPYKYKVVNRQEYTTAISEGRKDIAYLMLTHSYWGGITIIDPFTHETLGGVHIDKCTAIDVGDLKDLVKAMEKAEKAKK